MLIRLATMDDVARLQVIDRASGAQFAEVGHPEMDNGDCISPDVAVSAISHGRLLVAVRSGVVIGYVQVDRCGDELCIAQITVDPDAQRCGVGSQLVCRVLADARRTGEATVVLSTQSDVVWNRPWYERLGFEVVAPNEWTVGMRRATAEQTSAGLDWSTRVHMRLVVPR